MTKGNAITENEKRDLIRRVAAEVDESYRLPVLLTPQAAMCIIVNLQLALRCKENTGPAAQTARQMIDGLTEKLREGGFPAHAELAELGNDESNDL